MRRRPFYVTLLPAVIFVLAGAITAAYGQTFSVVYNFGSKSGDPSEPQYSGIIAQGRDGNLYSTAPAGGANNHGAVFKITPAGALTLVYSFSGSDGTAPYGGVTLGTDGNFYGTTYQGGTNELGTVFKITPGGTLTTLHTFAGSAEGANSISPPIQGTDGNWYGTTYGGGTSSYGTVYKLTAAGVLSTLYSFDYTHGDGPRDPLVQGSDGNFYGTTAYGGTAGLGVVFKITSGGAFTVLYNFDSTQR